ncbi:DUF6388 family protein [Raoultella ornithinolytica]|nr:hypothetical protein [Raoultella ornithinolytica]ELN4409923.1 hypothetical protein [Raoultella ornithinolytica]
MFKDESHLNDILNREIKDRAPLTDEQKEYHHKMAEALGMTWEEYLEQNPQLNNV